MESELKLKAYFCKKCRFSTRYKQSYLRHMISYTHTNAKQLACSICHRGYCRGDELSKHLRNCHHLDLIEARDIVRRVRQEAHMRARQREDEEGRERASQPQENLPVVRPTMDEDEAVTPLECGVVMPPGYGSLKPPECQGVMPPGYGSLKPPECQVVMPPGYGALKPPGVDALRPPGCETMRPLHAQCDRVDVSTDHQDTSSQAKYTVAQIKQLVSRIIRQYSKQKPQSPPQPSVSNHHGIGPAINSMIQYARELSWGNIILQDMKLLWRQGHLCDTTLVCQDKIELKAHSCVLAAVSPYIRDRLDKETGYCYTLCLPGVHSEVLSLLLEYVYTGQLDEKSEHHHSALLKLAEQLGIQRLQDELIAFRQKGQERYNTDNTATLQSSTVHQSNVHGTTAPASNVYVKTINPATVHMPVSNMGNPSSNINIRPKPLCTVLDPQLNFQTLSFTGQQQQFLLPAGASFPCPPGSGFFISQVPGATAIGQVQPSVIQLIQPTATVPTAATASMQQPPATESATILPNHPDDAYPEVESKSIDMPVIHVKPNPQCDDNKDNCTFSNDDVDRDYEETKDMRRNNTGLPPLGMIIIKPEPQDNDKETTSIPAKICDDTDRDCKGTQETCLLSPSMCGKAPGESMSSLDDIKQEPMDCTVGPIMESPDTCSKEPSWNLEKHNMILPSDNISAIEDYVAFQNSFN